MLSRRSVVRGPWSVVKDKDPVCLLSLTTDHGPLTTDHGLRSQWTALTLAEGPHETARSSAPPRLPVPVAADPPGHPRPGAAPRGAADPGRPHAPGEPPHPCG